MDTLLIIDSLGKMQKLVIDTGLTTIGHQAECDITIPLKSGNLTIIRKIDEYDFEIGGNRKGAEGPFGFGLKQTALFRYDDYTFIYLFHTLLQKDQLQDWDINQFPKSPARATYPDDLLKFLLGIINADQGAILLLKEGTLNTLATKTVKLRDQAELFINRILENRGDETVIHMSYNTHTLLFQAGLTPLDFCIIQYPINDDERVVLYLPRTKNMKALPEGMLMTMLSLCAGNLVNHLLIKKYKKLQNEVQNVEHNFFWGSSPKMTTLKNYIDKLSKTNLSILIQGETGCGKEMLVNYLKSKTNSAKVVSVNCAAIPSELAESTLFGHKKGSFTGAINDQMGKIQEANGGILFLDEIGELELEIQAKLLRVLQENKVTPVGGKETEVNFWLLTATHRDLEEMIKEGTFREDLYFRINETIVKVPNLQERVEDIPAMAAYFTDEIVKANQLEPKILSHEFLDYLKARKWKGNIREFRSFLRKIILLAEEEIITLSSLSEIGINNHLNNEQKSYPADLQLAKKIFIETHIKRILEQHKGNKTQAAKAMGITTRNLYRLLPEKHDGLDIQQ